MELIYEEPRFGYLGYGRIQSYCRMRFWRDNDNDTFVVLATDPETEDSGTSITNAAETWARMAWEELMMPPLTAVRFFEHYPHSTTGDEVIDEITFDFGSDTAFRSPDWRRVDPDEFERLIDEPLR